MLLVRNFVIGLCLLLSLPAAASLATELNGVDVRGQPFSLQHGQVSVVIMTSRHTQPAAEKVLHALKPLAANGRAQVACIIDFMGIPRIFHGLAQRKIRDGTRTSPVRYLAARDDHWRKLLAAQPDQRVDIYVFDRDGLMRGHFNGDAQIEAAVRLIDKMAP